MKKLVVKIVFIIVSLAIFIVNLFFVRANTTKVIANDVISYYSYLPAVFIYKDLSLRFIDKDSSYFRNRIWADTLSNQCYQIRTTMGVAVLYSPFFILAHTYSKLTGELADGYSSVYEWSLIVAAIFYFLAGLYFLERNLLKYFSPKVTAITLILIVFGTNLFVYVTLYAAMSHSFSFSLIAIALYYIDKWYETGRIKDAVILGLLYGMISLVRPTNAILAVVIMLYGIDSLASLRARFLFWLHNWMQVVSIVFLVCLIWAPQLFYWYHITGTLFHNSYAKSGGEFFFANPQIINQLFSFRKGLLLYSPLIGFAFVGLILLYFSNRKLFIAFLLFTFLNIYVLASWWAWWFGGGFGSRLYVDSYAIMAVGLASFLAIIARKSLFYRLIVGFVILFFVFLNLFQSYQFCTGKLHYVAMTKKSYMSSFLNMNPDKEYYDNLVDPNIKNARKGIYYQDELTYREVYEQNSEIEKIKQIEFYIRNTPDYLEAVRKKALKRNISLDSMIRIDALWTLHNKKK